MTAGSLPHDPPALHLNRTTGIVPKTDNFLFTRVLVVLDDVMRFHDKTSRRRVPGGQTHVPPSFKCPVCLHSLPLPSSPSIPPPSRSLCLSFIFLPALSPLCVLELAVGGKKKHLLAACLQAVIVCLCFSDTCASRHICSQQFGERETESVQKTRLFECVRFPQCTTSVKQLSNISSPTPMSRAYTHSPWQPVIKCLYL